MKKIQKIIVAILSIFLLFNSTSSVVKGYAEENVATQSANVESIVAGLKELHPEFSENEIRTAVNQAINGQVITLPSDPSERGSAFRRAWQGVTTGQLAFAINLAISLATGGAISNLASKLGASALRSVRYSITAELAKWGTSAWGAAFIETALFVADPGSFIANSIDSVDFYPNNGRINLWK